ncbi:glycoside hydrolase superfamily [Xylaria acuta]|nr:glycoside hydrolase superfamily [Xylaria acuta]
MRFPIRSAWATALAYITLVCHAHAFRNVIWHPDIPTNISITAGITHVVMAFVDPIQFSTMAQLPSPPIMPVRAVRGYFDHGTKVGISLGGWGPFSTSFSSVSTEENRAAFAANLAIWVEQQGYDFVDIDWEYPGGNGAETPTNATEEIEIFPLLLDAIKRELKRQFISLSVAGTPAGMEAFNSVEQTKAIGDKIDFVTVMAYDFVNRASLTTGHHTDVLGSRLAIRRYVDLGLPAEKINLGLAFYAKYFEVDGTCNRSMLPGGCSILPAQDNSGADTYKSGVLTFESRNMERPDVLPALQESPNGSCGHSNDIIASFKRARENSVYDQRNGGVWYLDETTSPKIFWTWETIETVTRKFYGIINSPTHKLGGISSWSLGQNSGGWEYVQRIQKLTHTSAC